MMTIFTCTGCHIDKTKTWVYGQPAVSNTHNIFKSTVQCHTLSIISELCAEYTSGEKG